MVSQSRPAKNGGKIVFQGKIDGVFFVPNKPEVMALTLIEIEGEPRVGLFACFGNDRRKIIELGRNSTDGQAVSHRNCLTRRPCAPYGSIAVEWSGPRPDGLMGARLTGMEIE